MYQYGLFENKKLVGVVTYGMPATPSLCVGVAGKEYKDRVIELNRLAIENGFGGENRASFLVSKTLKMLPRFTFVVSYADTAWTHVGYVYQACNFLYTGLTAKRLDIYVPNGKHSRHYEKANVYEVHKERSQKHRYIYLVGSRQDKKKMKKLLRYKVYAKYPKGNETKYDTSDPQRAIPEKIINMEGERHDRKTKNGI